VLERAPGAFLRNQKITTLPGNPIHQNLEFNPPRKPNWKEVIMSETLVALENELEARKAQESVIRIRAYERWEARGCPDGSDLEDWFTSEQELSHQTV